MLRLRRREQTRGAQKGCLQWLQSQRLLLCCGAVHAAWPILRPLLQLCCSRPLAAHAAAPRSHGIHCCRQLQSLLAARLFHWLPAWLQGCPAIGCAQLPASMPLAGCPAPSMLTACRPSSMALAAGCRTATHPSRALQGSMHAARKCSRLRSSCAAWTKPIHQQAPQTAANSSKTSGT